MDPLAATNVFNSELDSLRARAMISSGTWKLLSVMEPEFVVEIPHHTGARRRFKVRLDGWPEQPPSIKPVDARGNDVAEPAGGLFMQLNTGFGLCAPGTREYHAHHGENPWANIREATPLFRILARLAYYYGQAQP